MRRVDQVALVFGHRSADLQHELVVGILAHRPLEKLDLAATFFQFLNQEHLIDILAGKSCHLTCLKTSLPRKMPRSQAASADELCHHKMTRHHFLASRCS